MQVKCLNCSKTFEKRKVDVKRSPNHFCGRSCSVSYSNRKNPKRQPEGNCKNCDVKIKTNVSYCKDCRTSGIDYTLKEAIYTNHHKSSAFALVRSRARKVAKQLGWNACKVCGYSKHIEIGHVKAISEFDESTLLSTINHPDNLLPLCRNCHWEFDHGLIIF